MSELARVKSERLVIGQGRGDHFIGRDLTETDRHGNQSEEVWDPPCM